MSLKSIAQGLHKKRVLKEARAKIAAQVAAEEPAPDAPAFTREELEAMWHELGEPGDTRWTALRSALVKLDAYVKRARGEG